MDVDTVNELLGFVHNYGLENHRDFELDEYFEQHLYYYQQLVYKEQLVMKANGY